MGWPWLLLLCGLFGIALAWRLAYLGRLRETPFWASLAVDARIYWDWSEHLLRHGVSPPAPFYLAPLYPYGLAGVRALFGGGIDAVLTTQAMIGAVAVVLLADATRRVAGTVPGLIVGGVLAFFRASTFFDGLVLPESLLFLLESVLVWFVVRTDWSRAGMGAFAAYGLLVGVLAQGRASAGLLIVLVVPLAWGLASSAHRLRSIAASTAVLVACVLPSALANHRVSGELIPFTYNLGFNLFVGNNPDATGAFVDVTQGSPLVPLASAPATTGAALDGRSFAFTSEGRTLKPGESSAYWTGRALDYMRSAPGDVLRLAGKKVLLAWNHREVPQIESMDSLERAAGPLGLRFIGGFGLLAVIGLVGAVVAVRRGPAERWLVGYLALATLAMIPFFVTDRYRHHLVPALAVLAGVGGRGIVEALRRPRGTSRMRTAAGVALATALVMAPVRAQRGSVMEWSVAADHAARLLERGANTEAVQEFARAEALMKGLRENALSPSGRTELASFYDRYGVALDAIGRHPDALERWERSVRLNPHDARALARLAAAYERAGRTTDAERLRKQIGAASGGRSELLLDEGWAAARRGDLTAAERSFLAALEASPHLPGAWEGLIRLRIQQQRFDAAQQAVDAGRGQGLDVVTADVYACFLAAQRGDLALARRIYGGIPPQAATKDPNVALLLEHARRAIGRVSP